MRDREITIGGRYLAQVSGRVVVVRVEAIATRASTGRKSYTGINETTGRRVHFRSAQRFRGVAS